jgi:hypothetical protein
MSRSGVGFATDYVDKPAMESSAAAGTHASALPGPESPATSVKLRLQEARSSFGTVVNPCHSSLPGVGTLTLARCSELVRAPINRLSEACDESSSEGSKTQNPRRLDTKTGRDR